MRAKKTNDLNVKRFPIPNDRRGFLQISGFDNKVVQGPKKTLIKTQNVNVAVQKLVEWNIQNPENTQNAFTGQIRLYSLKPLGKVYTDVISYNSDLEDVKFLEYYEDFVGLSLDETVSKINTFIKGVNEGKILNGPSLTSQFPFVYRPATFTRNILDNYNNVQSQVSTTEYSNILSITNQVTLNAGLGASSYKFAIVRTKNEIGRPIKIDFEEVQTKETTPLQSTVALLGSDTVYLLSPLSNKKVNFENSIYGFSQQQIEELVHPNTSSSVRGEELIELLNLIVRFLTTHVHPLPGVPPVPVGTDGTQVNQILFELQNAANKILNPNIRIN